MSDFVKRSEVLVIILGRGAPVSFAYNGNLNLMEAMIHQGTYISASCGGRGTCGKCRVQVMEGSLAITSDDKEILSELELQQGYRLSCKAYPRENCTVRLVAGDEADFDVVSVKSHVSSERHIGMEEYYSIAVDIGTTTIAISMIGIASGNILKTHTAINKQRAYGADVISRIKASTEGKMAVLQQCIRKDLLEGIMGVIKEAEVSKECVQRIAIAGNTTMGHLLLGFSCETLGNYPFTPGNIGTIELSFVEVFETEDLKVPVVLLPGISAFVGGDIVAGLFDCSFDRMDQPCMLIDLGTNGEMAIGNKDRILVTSTAAGPAFEGGNITCGVGSVAGAICNVTVEREEVKYHTIGNKPPVGICGTGVIELTSELINQGIVDDTGLLCEKYFEEGYPLANDSEGMAITLTQKDIREIQLAKSAVRAGVEILIRRYGITYEDISTVYLAGGFGYKLNIEKAVHIGLLPQELSGKIRAIGNSALSGAIRYLMEGSTSERMNHIIKVSSEIPLSMDQDFNGLYIENMNF